MTAQTTALDREIEQIEDELAQLRRELEDLDERGIYRITLESGQVVEAQLTGDELRFDQDALIASMGLQTQTAQSGQQSEGPIPPALQKYLPYLLIGGGVVIILFIGMLLLGNIVRKQSDVQAQGAPASATPTPTATITPTPMPTPTPTPALIPNDFIERAPALLSFPALGLKWDISKGEWVVTDNQVVLAEEGEKVRYYKSFVGVGNTVLGGNGTTPEDPFYALRSADINDILYVTDRAGRVFTYRMLPFGGDRVERWITPNDTWVAEDTDHIALTLIIRVQNKRMVLRGKLYDVDLKDD